MLNRFFAQGLVVLLFGTSLFPSSALAGRMGEKEFFAQIQKIAASLRPLPSVPEFPENDSALRMRRTYIEVLDRLGGQIRRLADKTATKYRSHLLSQEVDSLRTLRAYAVLYEALLKDYEMPDLETYSDYSYWYATTPNPYPNPLPPARRIRLCFGAGLALSFYFNRESLLAMQDLIRGGVYTYRDSWSWQPLFDYRLPGLYRDMAFATRIFDFLHQYPRSAAHNLEEWENAASELAIEVAALEDVREGQEDPVQASKLEDYKVRCQEMEDWGRIVKHRMDYFQKQGSGIQSWGGGKYSAVPSPTEMDETLVELGKGWKATAAVVRFHQGRSSERGSYDGTMLGDPYSEIESLFSRSTLDGYNFPRSRNAVDHEAGMRLYLQTKLFQYLLDAGLRISRFLGEQRDLHQSFGEGLRTSVSYGRYQLGNAVKRLTGMVADSTQTESEASQAVLGPIMTEITRQIGVVKVEEPRQKLSGDFLPPSVRDRRREAEDRLWKIFFDAAGFTQDDPLDSGSCPTLIEQSR
jgi:hypothetical protein